MTIPRKLAIIAATLAQVFGGVEFSSKRLYEREATGPGVVPQEYVSQVLVMSDGDHVIVGFTEVAGRETIGGPCPLSIACVFVARVSPKGQTVLFRYLPFSSPGAAVLGRAEDLWVRFYRLERVDFDLAGPESSIDLVRIDLKTGSVLSSVRLAAKWWSQPYAGYAKNPNLMAVDARGGLWLAGYAEIEIPVTGDAIQPWISGGTASLARRRFPGSLMRLAPDGSRITYATYLGDGTDAVGALVIDQAGDLYAVGSRIWKISPEGRLIWSTWVPPGAALAAAIGPTNDLFVAGCTTSQIEPFYTTSEAFQTVTTDTATLSAFERNYYPGVCYDGFITRLTATGEIVYSTLLGNVGSDAIDTVAVNSRNEAFFAGQVGLNRDLAWNTVWKFGRLSGDGGVLHFLTGRPAWHFASASTYISSGDDMLIAGQAVYPSVDGRTRYFIGLDRIIERVGSMPRVDGVARSGSLTDGFQIVLSGAGFCDSPRVLVEDREYAAHSVTGSGLTFSFNARLQPPPADAYDGGDGESAFYAIRVRCGESASAPLYTAIPFRVRPTP